MGEGKLCLEPGNTAQNTSSKTVCLYLYVDARRHISFNTFPAAGLAVGARRYGRHDHWTSNTWTTLCVEVFSSLVYKSNVETCVGLLRRNVDVAKRISNRQVLLRYMFCCDARKSVYRS
jgi:hypothetical protein